MSQQNVEIVRRSFEAYARGDLSAMMEHAHPDQITYRAEPDGATYHGREGLLKAIAEWVEDFEEFTATPEEFIDAGDQVVVRVHQSAIGSQSGVPIEADFWFVHTLSEAWVTRLDMLASKAQAFEVAGLSERRKGGS
jgi:ketosteroid isomerase-like protein